MKLARRSSLRLVSEPSPQRISSRYIAGIGQSGIRRSAQKYCFSAAAHITGGQRGPCAHEAGIESTEAAIVTMDGAGRSKLDSACSRSIGGLRV